MTDTPLRRGDTVVLYTDGVLDTVGDDGRFGDERLLALLDGRARRPRRGRRAHRRGARGVPVRAAARRHRHRRHHRGRRACRARDRRGTRWHHASRSDPRHRRHPRRHELPARDVLVHGVPPARRRPPDHADPPPHRHGRRPARRRGRGRGRAKSAAATTSAPPRARSTSRRSRPRRSLEGARELIEDLKGAGREVVLASSAKAQEVDHYLDLLDARELVDGWTTSADVERTKPRARPRPRRARAARLRRGGHGRRHAVGRRGGREGGRPDDRRADRRLLRVRADATRARSPSSARSWSCARTLASTPLRG